MLKINEIFHSIQGESSLVGHPTVFVRTSGCHLRCTYCDTTYAYYDGHKVGQDEILDLVSSYATRHVCVTGGEPLLQPEVLPLLSALCDRGHMVSLETSGDLDCGSVDPRVLKVIDIKTPDSGEPDAFAMENLRYIGPLTEYKFVICSEADFHWAQNFAQEHHLFEKSLVFYSPSFGKVDPKWLAEQILIVKSPARLQLQMHKILWPEQPRGV